MRVALLPRLTACFSVLAGLPLLSAWAAPPKVEQTLQLAPVQTDVEFDRPTPAEISSCKVAARRLGDYVGWVVENPDGAILRRFIDTNGDNVVDRWSYFKDGLEVYRDVDSDFDGKADQYRWLRTGGSRWATDKNQDGKIDAWRSISAEEVTAEIVAALALRDIERFSRLVLTDSELKLLGLGPEKAKELAEKSRGAVTRFRELISKQKEVTGTTKWVQFSGSRPGVVPAGTNGSTKDLRVYENVVAIVQTGGEHGQVYVGTLVGLGDVWRAIDVPRPISEGEDDLAAAGFFFRSPLETPTKATSSGPTDQTQQLLGQLERLDAAASQATSDEQRTQFHAQRAELLERIAQLAANTADRAMWLRQLADTVSAAVQSGEYPEGAQRLTALFERLAKNPTDKDLAAYVRFRQLMAEYGLAVQGGGDFVKIQTAWLEGLEQYIGEYPKSPDTAEAMLQMAISEEFAGEEGEAKKWYDRAVKEFPNSSQGKKAAGALTRLESVGKAITFRGKGSSGGVVDLSTYRGKVVLIQYWASWCEPCKVDMATLRELWSKYRDSGFHIIGVNLDTSLRDMTAYLAESRLPWPQIYEEGGLDSRPANELGILTVPTMILVDQQGRVVNRNIHVAELDGALKKLIR
ncbi:MAG: redoxin domain-containing protein [Planctomycetota bacterium]|jgi:thiol-disulfide isomerase/thioredoxin